MTQAEASDPVRRKIRSAAPSAAGPVDDRQARLWRQVVARALKAAVGLNVLAREVAVSMVPPDELAALPAADEMTALMENGEGDVGMALVDRGLLSALIEMQTIGRVTDRAPPARTPTAVDAALAGPAIDRLLATGARGFADHGMRDALTGYRFAMLTDPGAPPTLALADILHKCLTLEMNIEGGTRAGRLRFLTPDTGATEDQKAAGRADWSQKITTAVLGSDLTLEARMGRIRMPIDQVMALSPGDLVPFSREDLRQVRLVAGRDAEVARARLGQAGGVRAVKILHSPAAQDAPAWTRGPLDDAAD